MDSEISSIVKNMARGKKDSVANSDILVYQLGQMAHLLSLLAEEAEKQSAKLSEQTDKLIQYTRTIRYLTWALLLLGGIQIFMFILKS